MPHSARIIALLISVFILDLPAIAQKKDSLVVTSGFSGLVGITNNGISIIPTFSLNAPAYNFLLSVKKKPFQLRS